ncbi:hypothetical protein HZH68_007075 [Vespula germanica]|uniref:Uncharacterized protein n=1 Tax=Vespula germanica TaxID=30212 RepID=A0A834N9Y4_VESGE|nr:hypothetical protein HZH68_007075 [Vespula germanica]
MVPVVADLRGCPGSCPALARYTIIFLLVCALVFLPRTTSLLLPFFQRVTSLDVTLISTLFALAPSLPPSPIVAPPFQFIHFTRLQLCKKIEDVFPNIIRPAESTLGKRKLEDSTFVGGTIGRRCPFSKTLHVHPCIFYDLGPTTWPSSLGEHESATLGLTGQTLAS